MNKYHLIILSLFLSSCKMNEKGDTPHRPDFIGGTHLDVFQMKGDTTTAHKKLEKISGNEQFKIEATNRINYSQKQLIAIQDELSKRFQDLENESTKNNVTGFGVGLHYIDIDLIVNTPEKQKEFREKIMDSPAFRFNGPAIPVINEKTGVNDTLGIYLRPEYSAYSTDSHKIKFILYNNSGVTIKCGEHYYITYQDENGIWRELPINSLAIDIAYGINHKGSFPFEASLYPDVHPNRPGHYRFFYRVWIGRRQILMMSEFQLTDKRREWEQVSKTPIPPKMFQDASEQQVRLLKKEYDEAVYDVVEVMPEFPGGMPELLKFVDKSLQYPQATTENSKKERVIVQVIIDKDGSVTEPVILRHVNPELDKEALRIISLMPKWKPGTQHGKAVKVKYTFPITFVPVKSGNKKEEIPISIEE